MQELGGHPLSVPLAPLVPVGAGVDDLQGLA